MKWECYQSACPYLNSLLFCKYLCICSISFRFFINSSVTDIYSGHNSDILPHLQIHKSIESCTWNFIEVPNIEGSQTLSSCERSHFWLSFNKIKIISILLQPWWKLEHLSGNH